jgi:hypothetical protein
MRKALIEVLLMVLFAAAVLGLFMLLLVYGPPWI